MKLDDQIAALPSAFLQRIEARGFDAKRLRAWAETIGTGRDERNRLKGSVEPPLPGDIAELPAEGSPERAEAERLGKEALARGDVALCVLSGGMATRMGGVVKALVEALPARTFLDLRLAETQALSRIAGRSVPLWLMTSEATDHALRKALGQEIDGEHIAAFEQFVSLRLTPEGLLFYGDDHLPSVYATGHGDLPDALRLTPFFQKFAGEKTTGKKVVAIANIDNLGATVDPLIVGLHLQRGRKLTVEVVDKVGSDKGGGPVRHDGRPIILEEFRLPNGFDPRSVPVFNTNTFLIDAEALANLSMEWTYVEVEKTIDQAKAIQFERLLGEITTAIPAQILRVPRDGIASRFLPVKDMAELEKRRPEIEAIAGARGLVG